MPSLFSLSDSCNLWTLIHQGSSVPGLLQVRIPQWVAMPSLQGIFPTQRSNLCLLLQALHTMAVLYHQHWEFSITKRACKISNRPHKEALLLYMSLAWFSVFSLGLIFLRAFGGVPYAASGACLAASWNVGPVRTKSLFRLMLCCWRPVSAHGHVVRP